MIVLNGEAVSLKGEIKEISLLEFLRDHLNLTGTKYGCGKGLCGACTVHVNGEAVRSCQTTVEDVDGQEITTIEGLANSVGQDLHPLQQAWINEAVPQCGYCQAGQIMQAASLLRKNPNPTEANIREEMSGNLCRCGTYNRIQRAILRVGAGDVS